MLTIPNAVEEVIKKKPFLEGALVEGLINLSALARQLKPEIEKQVGKSVNDSAVIMALNRLVPRLELMSTMKFKKVVSSSIVPLVDEIFADEHKISQTQNLSSITVKLPAENAICPGVYYYIFKELAWDNINIAEVISTTNEFTVVISDDDIHRAFTILMEAKRSASI